MGVRRKHLETPGWWRVQLEVGRKTWGGREGGGVVMDPEFKAGAEVTLDLLAIELLITSRRWLAESGLSPEQVQQYEPRLKAEIERLKRKHWAELHEKFR